MEFLVARGNKRNETAIGLHVYQKGPPIGVGWVMQGGVNHTGVGWVMQGRGESYRGGVGHEGWGGSCWVEWCGDGMGM